MNGIISKTLGGLERATYLRHLFFGLCFSALISSLIFNVDNGEDPQKLWTTIAFLVLFGALYPYSRFVYESIASFVLGDNVIYGNILVVMISKWFTMALCYTFSIFIAPIGLIWLYFKNR